MGRRTVSWTFGTAGLDVLAPLRVVVDAEGLLLEYGPAWAGFGVTLGEPSVFDDVFRVEQPHAADWPWCEPSAARGERLLIVHEPTGVRLQGTFVPDVHGDRWLFIGTWLASSRSEVDQREGVEPFAPFDPTPRLLLQLQSLETALADHRDQSERLRASRRRAREVQRQLQLLEQRRGAMLASVAAGLRTPLAALEAFVLAHASGESTAVGQVHARAADACTALHTLIEQLSDVARIAGGEAEPAHEPVALVDELHALAGQWQPRAAARGVTLTCVLDPGLPREATLDLARIRVAVGELLDNAVRVTPAGGLVELSAAVFEGTLGLQVRDTGAGIDPARVDALWERFCGGPRGDAAPAGEAVRTTAAATGSGLGLYRVKMSAQLLGGSCGADSTPGVGSTFWLRVPLGQAAGLDASAATPPSPTPALADRGGPVATALPQVPAAPAGGGLRVLLVDDNHINRALAARTLESLGHQVQLAVDGVQAVARVAHSEFDLVLMDCFMPEMDGFTATRAIRAMEGARGRLPVIGCTASDLPEDLQACDAAGMNLVIVKPVTRAKVLGALARVQLTATALRSTG